MVATEGWKLLPQYIVDLDTGEWRHHTNTISKDRKWLGSIRYVDGKMTMNERRISGPGMFPQSYSECLQTARNLFNRSRKTAIRNPYNDQNINFDARAEKLRWFMTQQEAQGILTGNYQNIKSTVPFDPTKASSLKKRDKESASITPVSNTSSPRHYSLPAIDDHRIIGCSSPVPYFVQDVNTVYYSAPYQHPPLNFAIGETVNSNSLNPTICRERCFSLGAPNVSPPVLSPQTRTSLGINPPRQRNCSCSSQNDMQSLESDTNLSPTQSLNVLTATSFDFAHMERSSPVPDLRTYVTEMTKELATNIKSEIREVISIVEDGLENSENVDVSYPDRQGSGSDDGRSDSISANEVAEYLEKVSKEMVNEIKSDIRDVVSAVDVYFPGKRSYSRGSSSGESEKLSKQEIAEHTPGSSSETVIHVINKSSSSPKLNDEDTTSEKSYKNKHLTSAVTMLSSQDSGINLSFQEQEEINRRSSSESNKSKGVKEKVEVGFDKNTETLDENISTKRVCVPKGIWQNTVEVIQEFEMIRNGDKVMVCLSGGKDSLSLLHALLQYQSFVQSKGISFTVGAITVDPEASGCDPCVLMTHLKSLGVHYIVDDQNLGDSGKFFLILISLHFCI